jgi:hypothetical protein
VVPSKEDCTTDRSHAKGQTRLGGTICSGDVSSLHASIDEMTSAYADVGGYFADTLGIDVAAQQQLVATLTC